MAKNRHARDVAGIAITIVEPIIFLGFDTNTVPYEIIAPTIEKSFRQIVRCDFIDDKEVFAVKKEIIRY